MSRSSGDQEWFESWFDSPYYHLLYKNRDHHEAQVFIDHLIQFLNPSPQARFLDLACGRGRHSVYLNQKGFDTTGVDLSPQSIEFARQFESSSLRFAVHDMRKVYQQEQFDVIFNLFTSFGYFDDPSENIKVIHAVREGLVKGGIFAFDFLNAEPVKLNLEPEEHKTLDGITFHIKKELVDNTIVKHIRFSDQQVEFRHQERVTAFSSDELHGMFESEGLKVLNCFGDYDLQPYVQSKSPRLILIAQKPSE